jgi:hypothetical protein
MNVRAYETMLIATGQMEKPEPPPLKDKKASRSGRLGGLKGRKACAEKLTATQRAEIAKNAASARWQKN